MKKCSNCGLVNEDSVETCEVCGLTVFLQKPQRNTEEILPLARVSSERRGAMVILKCRTPAEARLVRGELEAEDIIALVPEEDQMIRQQQENGYVEVQIPAEAYDSIRGLKAVVEFSPAQIPPGERRLSVDMKVLALVLGIAVIPGVMVFAYLLWFFERQGEKKSFRELQLWFAVGVGVLAFVLLVFLSSL